MLLAETDPAVIAFVVALTPLVVIVTTILQSWYQQRVAAAKERADKETADKKAAADKLHLEETAARLATKADETAQAITAEVKTVQQQVNGEGLGGKLDAVIAEQKRLAEWTRAHDAQDNQRHDDMIARFVGLRRAESGDRPPAGG